jgi:hypothetical protein
MQPLVASKALQHLMKCIVHVLVQQSSHDYTQQLITAAQPPRFALCARCSQGNEKTWPAIMSFTLDASMASGAATVTLNCILFCGLPSTRHCTATKHNRRLSPTIKVEVRRVSNRLKAVSACKHT